MLPRTGHHHRQPAGCLSPGGAGMTALCGRHPLPRLGCVCPATAGLDAGSCGGVGAGGPAGDRGCLSACGSMYSSGKSGTHLQMLSDCLGSESLGGRAQTQGASPPVRTPARAQARSTIVTCVRRILQFRDFAAITYCTCALNTSGAACPVGTIASTRSRLTSVAA